MTPRLPSNEQRSSARAEILGIVLLACALVAASCSDTNSDAEISIATSVVEQTISQTEPSTDAAQATTVLEAPEALAETNQFNLLEPGRYVSDLLSLELEITTTTEFNVSEAFPGKIVIQSGSAVEDFTGVGFLVVDTLLDSDVVGRQRSRLPATLDLSDFLESRDGFDVVERREDELGGLPADVWRIEYTEPCDQCWFETLFNTAGWTNLWGTSPGQVQELWTIDAPGSPLIVSVEAPEGTFEAWSDEVNRHLFDELQFGEPTGYSLQRPAAEPFDVGFGEFAIGRSEIEVVDSSRPTIEVNREGIGVVVAGSEERRLLLGVSYPSDEGGFGSVPADGVFPLVVVAHALFDAGVALPADRQLSSHGFVVVTIRFPESSFPGDAAAGVPFQPADVSFVIDEIRRGVLSADLNAVTDTERIGVIGHSAGATTAFGLVAYACCQDDRIDAVVAHAGTPYDFESTRVPAFAPTLHVVSKGDLVAPADALFEFHEASDDPSSIAVLQHDSHLGWLNPGNLSYDDAFALSLAFLDQQLRGSEVDIDAIVADSVFVDFVNR